MIGHVFQNMLAMVGQKEQDDRLLKLSKTVQDMMATQTFDNMMGPKVPHLKSGMLNLLKVVDLPP